MSCNIRRGADTFSPFFAFAFAFAEGDKDCDPYAFWGGWSDDVFCVKRKNDARFVIFVTPQGMMAYCVTL